MSNAISFWALEVPAGEGPTPMISDIPRHSTTVRITMAAIDPTAAPLKADEPLMATLKIMRRAPNADDYDMSDDEDEEDDEEDDEESEDEAPKGKDGKKLSKKEADAAVKKALQIAQENAEKMEVDAEDDDEEDEELEEGDFEVEEITICTLDPKNHYQQTLDLTIDEDDEIFFKVVGNFDVSLSGNYMAPAHDHDHDNEGDFSESDEDSDYDLSPDEDELYGAGSDDELDNVADPRITEVASDEETPKKSDKKAEKKSLKRAAEEPAKDEAKPEEKKLSKKQLKKLKANDGKAVDASAETPDKKSVKFAEKLEQGPTSSAEKPKAEKAKPAAKEAEKPKAAKPTSTVVQGVVIEDKKVGTGAVAKNGAKLGMRYIGKLQNGKTFDSNTKGKPFNFKLGRGEVIKGWDVGLAGMRIGGERRLTIPPNMAYGKQANAGIPANSTLIFDVKLLEVK